MKRLILVLLGFLPLPVGMSMHPSIRGVRWFPSVLIQQRWNPSFLYSLGALFVWFLIGMLTIKLSKNSRESILLLNTPAFIMLLLELYIYIVSTAPWRMLNWPFAVILGAHAFFYPIYGVVGIVYDIFIMHIFLGQGFANFVTSMAAFVCMAVVSHLGRVVAERRIKQS